MRRRGKRLGSRRAVEVNLTPMIDMVFILLIFFIVSTTFVKETGVEVERPTAASAHKQQASILIAVTESGEVWMENRRIAPRAVRAMVERALAQSPEAAVVVVADRGSRTGVVMEVMDQARLAGVAHVALAARTPEG